MVNERMGVDSIKQMRGADKDLGIDLFGAEFNRDIGVELPEDLTEELELDTSEFAALSLRGSLEEMEPIQASQALVQVLTRAMTLHPTRLRAPGRFC